MITIRARSSRIVIAGLCLALAVACSGPGEPSAPLLNTLYGQVFSDAPLLLIPAGGWDGAPRKMRWRLTAPATLICQVNRPPEEALRLTLVPTDRPLSVIWQPLWNGRAEPAVELLDVSGVLRITVPPALLMPGVHRLTLTRDDSHTRGRKPLELKKIEYDCGSLSGVLRADMGHRLKRIAGFLDRGVINSGEGRVHQGGFLFHGPHRKQACLNLSAEAVLRTVVDNRSKGEAHFSITAGSEAAGISVPPGGKEKLALRLPPGDHLLTFCTDGPMHGEYWWGSPYPWPNQPSELVPIIIITLDTTRRDAVSPYSGSGDATPVLRDFAGEATVFTRAFAVSPWTLPSHASIFTGRYPSEHGAGVRWASLPPGTETLAALLRARGYLTAGFAGGALTSARFGVAQGFSHYRDPDGFQTRAQRLTAAVIEYLDFAGNAPIFLFVNYFDPHFPYRAPERFRRQFQLGRLKSQILGHLHWPEVIAGEGEAFRRVCSSERPAPEEVLRCLRAAYHSEVAYMDQQLGVLFDELRRRDIYRRAFIAVLADHGEFLGEHGFYGHSFRLNSELIEIPCLVKWPGQSDPGVVDLPVSQVDLFPTVLMLAGAEARASSGVPLRPGDTPGLAQRPFLLMEEHSHSQIHPLGSSSIKLADHLYGMVSLEERFWAWDGGQRCFRHDGGHWIEEPCEVGWEEGLAGLLTRFPTGGADHRGQPERLDGEEREQLRQLGYLE